MANQLGFLLDQRYCIGCKGCQTVCQARNYSDPGEFLRITDNFKLVDKDTYISVSCHHCEKLTCLEGCPVGAIIKDSEKGIVATDYEI